VGSYPRSGQFKIGAIDCWVVPDGAATYSPEVWLANASDADRDSALAQRLAKDGKLRIPYNCLLVRSGGHLALIDTGAGVELAHEWEEPVGRAAKSLRSLGVSRKDIDVVIVSHAHPDHIGGLTTPPPTRRRPMFPRARHWFWASEWEAWTSKAAVTFFGEALARPASVHLPVIAEAGLVDLADQETEALPGVRLLSAPGHTPGHMAVLLTSGREGAIYLGDAITDELLFEQPGWLTAFEAIPILSVATRWRLLERAVRERLTVAAFHLPATGTVTNSGSSFQFHASRPDRQ
jgi:glyoxylase-like metal-dependent hydrolase (beta-lactamase superfamily II)